MTVIEKLENNIAEANSAFQNIKSKIVESGVEVAENTRPIELAPKVNEVFEAGKKSEYDAFWDKYQRNGGRLAYQYAFAGYGWDDNTFNPKYNIDSQNSVGMFMYSKIIDLEALLNKCGITFNISNSTNYSSLFAYTAMTVIPELVFSANTSYMGAMFSESRKLHTIRKITLKDGFNANMTDVFTNCVALENVVFEGVIPKHIYMQWSAKLSKASITSIIEHLSTTASGQTATFSKTAVETAFGSVESAEWQSLIAPKSNWTISLV